MDLLSPLSFCWRQLALAAALALPLALAFVLLLELLLLALAVALALAPEPLYKLGFKILKREDDFGGVFRRSVLSFGGALNKRVR